MDISMNDLLAGFETRGDLKSKIHALENALFESPDQIELEVKHHFANGLYARELFIPAGVTLTGKIHKTEHLNILAKGTIAVVTDEGQKTLEAPCTIVSPPNTKRAGYAITDCVWITVHATREKDLQKLEEELITKEYLSLSETKKVGS